MDELILIEPTMDYAEQIMDYRGEFLERGDEMNGTSGLRRCETAEEWLELVEQARSRDTCPAEWVPSGEYISVRKSDDTLVGMVNIRWEINEQVLKFAGHIGYSVRPAERRRGYAAAQLALALEECRKRGMDRVLITCDKENIASAKTIIKNGGVLENELWNEEDKEITQRYWIEL